MFSCKAHPNYEETLPPKNVGFEINSSDCQKYSHRLVEEGQVAEVTANRDVTGTLLSVSPAQQLHAYLRAELTGFLLYKWEAGTQSG